MTHRGTAVPSVSRRTFQPMLMPRAIFHGFTRRVDFGDGACGVFGVGVGMDIDVESA